MGGCHVTVGDKASPQRYATKDCEVSCRSRHSIGLFTETIRNGAVVAMRTASYPQYTKSVERPATTYTRCDGPTAWETVA